MYLKCLGADCDAVWRLWQDQIGESQLETVHIWSKAMPSLANNYSALEKQFLPCPLALLEAERLTINYEVVV